ncbi:uncharacterized protein LOC130589584 [Beta vulgaris subsp. vulgaris]|uniref:uncharacterized protein LOC130589584 n=1 Tax=Beta vulgaris subsp. vulgaris TaxID=3555 RepID=UPI0025467C92|nr:uncharacterized protein LOC130589584 [Beta vulgaris subsp. vulgaris]
MENWIREFDKIFVTLQVPEEMRVDSAAYHLTEDADIWWTNNKDNFTTKVTYDEDGFEEVETKEFGWKEFKKALRAEFFPPHMRKRKRSEFEQLEQGDMSVQDFYTNTLSCLVLCLNWSQMNKKELRGRDCEGNKVTCNYCKKEGHRAYECFTNPDAKIGRNYEVLRTPTASTASNRPTTSAATNRSAGTANAAQAKRSLEKKNTGNLNHLKQADADNQGNAVTGTFSIYFTPAYVLFDSGASHSFISETFAKRLNLESVTPCEADISFLLV